MDNFFAKMFQRREVGDKAPCSAEEGKPALAKGGSYSQQAVTVSTPDAALRVSPWYRAGEVLANTMSQLVMEYQKKNNAAHGGNYALDLSLRESKQLNYKLQMQPNPTMTAKQFLRQMTLNRFHQGNALAYIERDRVTDEILNIWLCTSGGYRFSDEGIKYLITYNTPRGTVTKESVDADDIIHWRNTFSNDGGLTGISTLHYAAQALGIAATNNRQAKEIAAKGGKYKILLSEKDQPGGMDVLNLLNKDQKKQQQDDLQDALAEGKDVLLMSGLMQAQVISQDSTQMQLLENRKWDVNEVARFSGVPLVLLMDYTNNTYKAPEQAMQAFKQFTISPMAGDFEQEATIKIVGVGGFPTHRIKFNEDSLMSLDPMGRAQLSKVLLECGIKCVDELRNDFGLPQLEGEIGKRHLVSTNLQPLDDLRVAGGAQELGPGNYTVKDNKKKDKDGEEGGEP